MRFGLALALLACAPTVAGAESLFTPTGSADVKALLARAPAAVRRAVGERAIAAGGTDAFGGALHLFTLYDGDGDRVALFSLSTGDNTWTVYDGALATEWTDHDGDGVPDERSVEHYQPGSGREILDERDTFVRRAGRWRLSTREVLIDCHSDGRYRTITIGEDGERRVRRSSCIVS